MIEDSDIEIRPVFEAEEFNVEFTGDLRAQENGLRVKIDKSGSN